MNQLRRIALIALTLSSAGFAAMFYVLCGWNQTPVVLPMPGEGVEVAEPFTITTRGDFVFELTVPYAANYDPPVSHPDIPPILCKLDYKIEGPDGVTIQDTIVGFDQSSEYVFGRYNHYESDPIHLTRAGDYTLRLHNLSEISILKDRGAMISLTRKITKPTETFLRFQLLRGITWLFFGMGVTFGLIAEILSLKKSFSRTH